MSLKGYHVGTMEGLPVAAWLETRLVTSSNFFVKGYFTTTICDVYILLNKITLIYDVFSCIKIVSNSNFVNKQGEEKTT